MANNTLQVLLKRIKQIVGPENVSINKEDLETHAKDRSFHSPVFPDIVIWPKSTLQVSEIMKVANSTGIPVTAWGGGSSLEGNPIPVKGGVSLDMTKMNKVLKVLPDDLQVRVQPGIIGDALNKQLADYSLFFPAFPGSSFLATIGGMIANNAGGMYAVKYGVVGDWVLSLEIVLANGDIIRTGNRSFKSVSGYDLKRLFIGSEGTLGIITEAVLKLTAIPQKKFAVMVAFPSITDAAQTALLLLRSDIKPAAVEFMDTEYIRLVNLARNAKIPEKPNIIIELHGDEQIILRQLKVVIKTCEEKNGKVYKKFISEEENRQLWNLRRPPRDVLPKILPNTGVLSAEIGLPLSKVEDFLIKASELGKKFEVQTIMFGHIGDGNFHGWALYEQNNEKSWKKVTKLNELLVTFAIQAGGTTTGEHGVGIGKRKFMPIEHPTSIDIMKNIKEMLDPKGILNPGKLLPGK
jgi:D-lactate dehydrogenase (cytochrome)